MGDKNTNVKKAAIIVIVSIVFSRLTGFFREGLIPNFIGVNLEADAYTIAFRIAGLMYDMLVGGAIAAALIPLLSGYIAKKDESEGFKAISTFINLLMIAILIFCTLGIIFAPKLVTIIAPGFESEYQKNLTVDLLRILFPSVAFLMLSGLLNGILNSYQRFVASAFGPSIYNIGCALSIYFFSTSKYGIWGVSIGVLGASILYFLVQLAFSFKNLKLYRFKLYLKHEGFRKLIKLSLPSLGASTIVQINVLIAASFASLFGAGAVTAYNIADRTWQMPYGIFAQGIGIAILPTLSASIAKSEEKNYKDILLKSLRMILFVTLPCFVGFFVLGEDIISTIFRLTNKFSEESIVITSNILMCFSFALISQSLVTVLNRAFYAKNDTKTPLYTGIVSSIVIIVLVNIVYGYTSVGIQGIAVSFTIGSIVNSILLLLLIDKGLKDSLLVKQLLVFLGNILIPTLVMMYILYYLNQIISIPNNSKISEFLELSLKIAIGCSSYFVMCYLFRVKELISVIQTVSRKGKVFFNTKE